MLKVTDYWMPQTLEEALELLASRHENMHVLAGGTDLVIEVNKRDEPVTIVDIGGIEELRFIREDSEKVSIGSLATFAQVQNSEIILKHCRCLAEAASAVGSPQIRNVGTIGGNLVHASPAADSVPCLVAMDAEITVASLRGKRRIRVADFLKGINKTDLAPDELVLDISFSKIPGLKSGFAKLGRRNALAISRISVAAAIRVDEEKVIREARVAFGSVAPNPFRSTRVENALLGKKITGGIPEDVLMAASEEVALKLGNRASAPYKKEAIKGVVTQAIKKAYGNE